jgi:hypothetical protein
MQTVKEQLTEVVDGQPVVVPFISSKHDLDHSGRMKFSLGIVRAGRRRGLFVIRALVSARRHDWQGVLSKK